MKEKLYQLDTNNNVKEWNIEVQDMGDYSEIVVRSGRLNGSLVENISKIMSGKNTGKINETDHYSQALSEANSKVQSQLRKGYVYKLEDVKSSSILGSGIPAPMLAHKYCKDGSQKSSKTLRQLGLVDKEIIVQPKLDGNRCLIKIQNGMPSLMYTRGGDVMPVQLEHVLDDLSETDFDDPIILDGELYSDEISFNNLNGLIKRVKATSEEIEKRKLIKFHLYDVMLNQGYESRYDFIKNFASENIVVVPSKKIIASDDNIQTELEKFLSDGFEGLMIRQLNMPYENKRTWQLCKCKVFEDDEFELIGFQEDVRGGFVGAFIMKMKDDETFNAGCSGQSVEERTEMWNNQDKYMGKIATVAYFGLSEYGIPRFPKFKSLR
jgi:DNA ligase-1